MEQEVFIKYFTGFISPQEETALWDWIDESEENRKEYLKLREVWDMYLLNRAPEEPAISFSQILAGYNRKQTAKPAPAVSKPVHRLRELVKIAAIFALAFGLSWYIYTINREKNALFHTIEVPSGQRVKLTLADGSLVWLNAQTKFTYPAVFDKHSRQVTLDGEGLFQITHDAGRPFKVQTAQNEITVLGTTFDVYAYSNSGAFETILIDGSVEITDRQSTGKKYRLQPGNKLYYNEEKQQMQTVNVHTKEYISWKDGIYYFNDITFVEMTKRLGHYYKTNIIINDSAVMNYRCTGKFRQYESITDIMNVVKSDMPFTYKYDKENNELVIDLKKKMKR
ncbi:MAG: FecR domain-containing protein [Tannerella sp.]|jgi:ferric-dicitrate binding protein FerR (iron transport regulator)|nr:FecR domain-containing protein [Tannerella sp.]